MERLTSWCEEIEEAFLSCEKCKKNGMTECWSQENCTQTAVDRLAEIEDILGDEYDLDRLRELVQADREGRCVIAEKPPESGNKYVLQTVQGCWINGDVTILKQSALKAVKEREDDDRP